MPEYISTPLLRLARFKVKILLSKLSYSGDCMLINIFKIKL